MAANFPIVDYPARVVGLSDDQWRRFQELAKKSTEFKQLHEKWNFNQVQSVSGPLVIRSCSNFLKIKEAYGQFEEIDYDFFKLIVRETTKKVLQLCLIKVIC